MVFNSVWKMFFENLTKMLSVIGVWLHTRDIAQKKAMTHWKNALFIIFIKIYFYIREKLFSLILFFQPPIWTTKIDKSFLMRINGEYCMICMYEWASSMSKNMLCWCVSRIWVNSSCMEYEENIHMWWWGKKVSK